MSTFTSKVFQTEIIQLAGTEETIVRGGRDQFPLLVKGFQRKNNIGVIGWGSQGPAQAMNLRDSLHGTDIRVRVGLQNGSPSRDKARAAGFTPENGTLGEMYSVISQSDIVLLLISDAAQAENHQAIFSAMKNGATLGLSHGFLLGHLKNIGVALPGHINVIGVCPKGMGVSVRRLYEQGVEVNGAGINCSFAVEQDIEGAGQMTDVAIAWAIAIGAPYVFQTTLKDEYISDIFGERGILLGGLHGIVEALYRRFSEKEPLSCEWAFRQSAENITSAISHHISQAGLIGLYDKLDEHSKGVFERIYASTYGPAYVLLEEIYDEVSSGNEIRSVVMAGQRLKQYPMGEIGNTAMWQIGERVRANRSSVLPAVNGLTAGLYCAIMMAQIDVLIKNGHCMSEVCNESIIEAVDSLNPYMHAKGIAYLVDNCSTTARLGARKWAPRFEAMIRQEAFIAYDDSSTDVDQWPIEAFHNHPVHEALAVCAELRPPVNISVNV